MKLHAIACRSLTKKTATVTAISDIPCIRMTGEYLGEHASVVEGNVVMEPDNV